MSNAKLLEAHPLVPKPLATPAIIKWTKKLHSWVGVLGAVLAFIFGWSGFMLNHRAHFTLGPEVVEVEMELPAPAQGFASVDDLAAFLDDEYGLRTAPRLEVMERSPGTARQPATEPGFRAAFVSPNGDVIGVWHEGDETVAVTRADRSFNRMINRLHVGRGTDGGWHFIIVAYSVMLIFLSLSGVLLWSRISGSAKIGGGLLLGTMLMIGFWVSMGP